METVTINKNSTGGYTVRWPSIENTGLSHEKHFTPAVGYKCRQEALRFARNTMSALGFAIANGNVPRGKDEVDKEMTQ